MEMRTEKALAASHELVEATLLSAELTKAISEGEEWIGSSGMRNEESLKDGHGFGQDGNNFRCHYTVPFVFLVQISPRDYDVKLLQKHPKPDFLRQRLTFSSRYGKYDTHYGKEQGMTTNRAQIMGTK
uniref:Uncharacterized protein n=1 Tax=Vitis vinifera TaxID=29760 RepID=A5ACU9_VITVI|nr:hypothetical protein VITISV_035735 [Vitis vinifera]